MGFSGRIVSDWEEEEEEEEEGWDSLVGDLLFSRVRWDWEWLKLLFWVIHRVVIPFLISPNRHHLLLHLLLKVE